MKAPTSQSGRTRRSMPIAAPQAVEVARKVAAGLVLDAPAAKAVDPHRDRRRAQPVGGGRLGERPGVGVVRRMVIAVIPLADGAPLRRLRTSEDAPPVKSIRVRSVCASAVGSSVATCVADCTDGPVVLPVKPLCSVPR